MDAMRRWGLLLAAVGLAGGAGAQQPPATDPALTRLGELVGGRWTGKVAGPQGDTPVEARYFRTFGGKGIHAVSIIGKGTAAERVAEAFYGWDAGRKRVYYLDMHGHDDLFWGWCKMNGPVLERDFERLVGGTAHWFATDELLDRNTLLFTVHSVKDGERTRLFDLRLTREEEATAPPLPAGTAPADAPAVLRAMGAAVGGTWANAGGQVALNFAWGHQGRSLRGSGTIFGTPTESRFGWDPALKQVFYIDFHGVDQVFFGHGKMAGEDMVFDFRTLVGAPSTWRSTERFTGDAYRALVESTGDGARQTHTINLTRKR